MTEPPTNAPPPALIAPASRFVCVQCRYDLTGSAVGGYCPECGTAVTRSLGGEGGHPVTSGYAVASLVLGILTLVGCTAWGLPSIVLGPLALVFAHLARGQVARGEAGGPSLALAKAGMVCGLIGLALAAVALALLAAMFLLPLILTAAAAAMP